MAAASAMMRWRVSWPLVSASDIGKPSTLPAGKKKPGGLFRIALLLFLASAACAEEGFGSGQLPGLMDESGEIAVGDLGQLDADPAFDAHVGRLEVGCRGFGDHFSLRAGWGGYPDGGVAVAVVVVGDHDEDALGYEEGWFAVGELF